MTVTIKVKNIGTITAYNVESIKHVEHLETIYIKPKFYAGNHYKLKDIKSIEIMED